MSLKFHPRSNKGGYENNNKKKKKKKKDNSSAPPNPSLYPGHISIKLLVIGLPQQ
jgi:hypothetical protein